MILPTDFLISPPRRLRRAALALALCAVGANAAAITLQQAYDAALRNDPAFRMNFYENEGAKENAILGRSALLPSVSASYSGNRNRADETTLEQGQDFITHPDYISRSSIVQVRQPLFALDALARYREGKSQAAQGAAQFQANSGEVILRVVGAYLDALLASDQLALAEVQRDAYVEQQKVNQRMFEKGEGTKTDSLETQARLDLAEAQVIEAVDNVTASRNTLEGIIGMDAGALDRLGARFHFAPLSPEKFEDWKVIALANNHDIETARLAAETARFEIDRQRAGHTPRVDLVAAYSKSNADQINTYNQSSTNRSIGVQVNIPLYAGGSVSAATRQAVAAHERALADLDSRTSKVLVELRKSHDLVVSSVRRVGALDKAVESSKLLMTATEQSIKGGVRINLDLLNAQQQLFVSQRDLAQARYTYLLGVLRLRASAGILSGADVRDIAAYFER